MSVARNEVKGVGNIQVTGNVHIVLQQVGGRAAPTSAPTIEQQRSVLDLVEKVFLAERGRVPRHIILGWLQCKLGTKAFHSLRASQLQKAEAYLQGWLACATDDYLPRATMIVQILRIGSLCSVQRHLDAFSEREFGTTQLLCLKGWALKCILARAMYAWNDFWASQED